MVCCFRKKRIKLKVCYEWALQQTCPGVDVTSDRKMHTSRLHYLFIKVLWKKIKYSRIHIRNIYKPSDTKVGVRGSQIYKSLKHFQSQQSVIKNKTERRMFLLRVGPAFESSSTGLQLEERGLHL